jgi:hypothetical protein
LASFIPEALSGDHRLERVIKALAAMYRVERTRESPHLEISPSRSSSPD